MSFLQDKIKQASQQYYSDGSSDMTDSEFDAALEALKKESPNDPLLTAVGHGYDLSNVSNKFKHLYGVVGSLDKCHNYEELKNDFKMIEVDASLKLDGISVVLYYKNGKLTNAVTRGNGVEGIDITNKMVDIVPNQIKDKSFTGGVRGEILMKDDMFLAYLVSHPDAKNARNTVAGIIGRNEIKDVDYLSVVVYSVLGDVNDSIRCKQHTLNRRTISGWLRENFDEVAPRDLIVISNSYMISEMNQLKDMWYILGYPADGIVLTDISVKRSEDGVISYNSQAFKFPSETVCASVEDVCWSLSKSNYMIPRVKIEPVTLSGTTVQYASGFNAEYIKNNQIGKGALITICKSGEIIPDIQSVIEPGELDIPTKCPECGHDLVWSGVHIQCPNSDCSFARITDLLIWSSTLVPLDNLGDKLRRKFYYQFYGDDVNIEKVMLNPIPNELKLAEGAQTKLFLDSIVALKENSFELSVALRSLNIPRLGEQTSTKLASNRDLVDKLRKFDNHNETMKNELISTIGTANAESIMNNLSKLNNINLIWDRIKVSDTLNTVDNIHVAITGKLSCSRSQFEKELKAKGYSVSDISSNTKFLITNDMNSTSSKNAKADKLGIPKISEEEFRNRYMK